MPPVKRSTSLAPIVFKDFSPGIAQNPGVNYPPEQATDQTWRCIALRGGGLKPLPKRTTPFTMPHEAVSSANQIAVNGLYVPPIPLLPTVAAFTPDTFPEHELMVGTCWNESDTHHLKLYRVRRYEATSTFDLIDSRTYPETLTGGALFTPNGMQFGTTRSNSADPTHYDNSVPIVVCMSSRGQNQGYLLSFPDDATPTTNATYFAYNDTVFLLNMACHQGRTVAQFASAYGHGVNTITFMGEHVRWTRVNTIKDWTPNTDPAVTIHVFPQIWVEENPSGLAFIVSMSANEMFAVKTRGGFYVSGDLDAPTVVSLPMVTGAEMQHNPAVTPMGVVYGSRSSGIWVWPHGDTSTLLSPLMTPDFWAITPGTDLDRFGGIGYQFARCDDWVLVTNNWMYDTVNQSWWRLEDPSVMRCRWMTSLGHFIYGSNSFYDASNPGVSDIPIALWRREDLTDNYQWQSQPIVQSIADIVNVAQIELVALGSGTVELALSVLDGTTKSLTINLEDRGFMERFRENFAMQGKYMQLTITAKGKTSSDPAPVVYSVVLNPFTEQPFGHTK